MKKIRILMDRPVPVFMCVLIALLCFGSIAWAEGNIYSGPWEVHPYFRVGQKYDDNIFLEPDADGDFITFGTAGLGVRAEIKEHMFEFDYHMDLLGFWDNSDQSTDDHSVLALVDLNSPTGFGLEFEDRFKLTSDPPDTEKSGREERTRNIANLVGSYGREKFLVEIGYSNVLDDYETEQFLDRVEQIVTLTPHYRFSPKTSLFLEYNFGWIDYDEDVNSDGDYHQIRAGVQGQLSARLTGTVKAGYQLRDYDQGAKKDFDGSVIYADLVERFSELTELKVFGDLAVNESNFEPNNYYRLGRIGVGVNRQLGHKLELNFEGFYQQNDYPDESTVGARTAKRLDDIYSAEIGLDYYLQEWVALGASYLRRERSSNLDAFDYENNVFFVNAYFSF